MDGFDNNVYETVETVEVVDSGNRSSVFAVISLVCGILALLCSCCGWLSITVSVAAVVLGILSLNRQEPDRGLAIAGIVCGGVGLLIAVLILIFATAASNVLNPEQVEDVIERIQDI